MQSVTVTEPRFHPEDVDALLASRRAEAEPRGRHGHPIARAADPKTHGKWQVGLPTTDFAQQAINRAQSAYAKAWPEADMDSLMWNVDVTD